MHIDRGQFFLLSSAVAVVTLFLFGRGIFSKKESQFRDDLWVKRQKEERAKQQRLVEDSIDKKILLEHRPDPLDQPAEETESHAEAPKAAPKNPFEYPNFRGAPHEILGIPLTADVETINKAFKFWIKRYHPDRVAHLGGRYVEQARRRSEQLNTARQELLRQQGK